MSTQSNLIEMSKALKNLEESGIYDVEKYSYALLHQTSQLEYFYCHLVKDGDCDETYYHVQRRPHVHQLAYWFSKRINGWALVLCFKRYGI